MYPPSQTITLVYTIHNKQKIVIKQTLVCEILGPYSCADEDLMFRLWRRVDC